MRSNCSCERGNKIRKEPAAGDYQRCRTHKVESPWIGDDDNGRNGGIRGCAERGGE